jgi:predicted dehydrogenase
VHRVLPALAAYAGAFDLAGYDLAAGPEKVHGFPVVQVRDDADLASRLHERHSDLVLIETPDDVHRRHIQVALESGARLVLSEKTIGFDAAEGAEVFRLCRQAEPAQQVAIIDHYPLLRLVRTLHANTSPWLGEVRQMRVILLESQGVPPHQERSHANGMTNFFHHVVALAGLWLDPCDLFPTEAGWACHPEARVPDTYRQARFACTRTGAVVLEGAAGKYVRRPVKQVHWYGTRGHAWLDRDRNVLHVTGAGGHSFSLPGTNGDTGYGELARALATGTPLPPLLAPAQALQVLRLVEQAHAQARLLPVYGDGDRPGDVFVCEWQLPDGEDPLPGRMPATAP